MLLIFLLLHVHVFRLSEILNIFSILDSFQKVAPEIFPVINKCSVCLSVIQSYFKYNFFILFRINFKVDGRIPVPKQRPKQRLANESDFRCDFINSCYGVASYYVILCVEGSEVQNGRGIRPYCLCNILRFKVLRYREMQVLSSLISFPEFIYDVSLQIDGRRIQLKIYSLKKLKKKELKSTISNFSG